MIRFNPWGSYPWENGKYSQNERATLEDNYEDDYGMYGLMGILLEALKDKLLEVERNGTVYSIPICNIERIFLSCGDCTIYLVENGHYYVSDLGTGELLVRTGEVIEVKYPEFRVV